jgi:hypothetical protein
VNASVHLFQKGPRTIFIHWCDYFSSVMLNANETKFTAAVKKHWTSDASSPDHDPNYAHAMMNTLPWHPSTEEQQTYAQNFAKQVSIWFSHLTSLNSDLVILEIPARVGIGRIKSSLFGVTTVPSFQIYDVVNGTAISEYPEDGKGVTLPFLKHALGM